MNHSGESDTGSELHPELQGYVADCDRAEQLLDAIVDGMSDDQFNQRPDDKSWSVAECISHLNTSAHATFPKIEEAIEKGRQAGTLSDGPYKYGFVEKWFAKSAGQYPPKLKARAPKAFAPPEKKIAVAEAVEEFKSVQDRWRSYFKQANGLDLGKVKVVSPISKLFRLHLGQYFRLVTGHQFRHLHQAEDVKTKITG